MDFLGLWELTKSCKLEMALRMITMIQIYTQKGALQPSLRPLRNIIRPSLPTGSSSFHSPAQPFYGLPRLCGSAVIWRQDSLSSDVRAPAIRCRYNRDNAGALAFTNRSAPFRRRHLSNPFAATTPTQTRRGCTDIAAVPEAAGTRDDDNRH